MTETEQRNKALVLEAFDTLFNKRDYAAAERFWSPDYIQHSAHIEPGREGLFGLVKAVTARHALRECADHRRRRLRDAARSILECRATRQLDSGRHRTDRRRSARRTLGCHPRRSHRRGVAKWAADVRRHLPHTGLTWNSFAHHEIGGSTDVTTEWQGRRDHRRQQRYRAGDRAEVRRRRRIRLHHRPAPERAGQGQSVDRRRCDHRCRRCHQQRRPGQAVRDGPRGRGRLDILVANSGRVEPEELGKITEENFDRTFDLNARERCSRCRRRFR